MERRAIFTREFWRQYALDVRRLHKDKRARRSFAARNLFLLFFIGYFGYWLLVLRSLHDTATVVVIVVVLVLIATIVGTVRWSQYRESRRQLAADIASAPAGVAERLQRMAHCLLAINERALSEMWLARHSLPEGFTAATRRVKIDALKDHHVWDEVPVEVHDWMMRPDGSWPLERSAQVLASAETLHALLWTLGLLPVLRPLDRMIEALGFDKLARSLVRPAQGVRPTWDIRVERNAAHLYFVRCYAEKIRRKEIDAESQEQADAVDDWMDQIQAGGNSRLVCWTRYDQRA